MNDKTEGIILKQSDFKDSDYLLRVITVDQGVISLIAKGAKKATSKNSYACSPLTLAAIIYDQRSSSLYLMQSASIINTYRNIRADLIKVTIATLMCDVIDIIAKEMINEDDDFKLLYVLLKESLNHLDQEDSNYIVLGVFISNILKVMGIAPQVDGCSLCGSSHVVCISIKEGGFLCSNCNIEGLNNSVVELKQFRLLNKASCEHIKILKQFEPFDFSIITILYGYLNAYGDINLASWRFLNELVINN